MRTIRNLMSSLIDYAGLFPPAQASMEQAVDNYAAYRLGEHAWMLGRFILPAARLDEFERCWTARPSGEEGVWRLSALTGGSAAHLERIDGFNRRNAGRAAIDAIETKAEEPGGVRAAVERVPPGIVAYVEISPQDKASELLAAIREAGARAKLRTGGVSPDLFVQPAILANFLYACVRANVPFKATAGLHHALPATRPLTYACDAPSGPMHGFLNVFLAAALLDELSPARTEALLADDRAATFRFEDNIAYWRDHAVTAEKLERARREVAVSFGSCSFEEPIEDLRTMGFL